MSQDKKILKYKFDKWFNSSDLPKILTKAKTLHGKECFEICKYFIEHKPKVIFEFGVQYGCSTRFFLDLADFLDMKIELHSFDIKNIVKYADANKFHMHVGDITNKVDEEFANLPKPDLVFLDAHPYQFTKNVMQKCLDDKIDFMCHDVSQNIGVKIAGERTKQFTDFSIVNAAWELYVMAELIDKSLWTKPVYRDKNIDVKIITGKYGLSICQNLNK